MKRKEEEVINALISLRELGKEEIEITASGFFLYTDIQLTTRQVAAVLRKVAEEIQKDSYFNHNIYKINLDNLMEMFQDESADVSESE